AAVIPYYQRKLQRFAAKLPKAHEIQRAALFAKIRRSAESRFGKDHGFREIKTVADYRRQMPISRYEYFAPYIQDVSQRRLDALFSPGEEVLLFGVSTATPGAPKLTPITSHWLREFRQTLEMWGVKAIVDHAEMIGTKILQISGPGDMGRSPSGLPMGM